MADKNYSMFLLALIVALAFVGIFFIFKIIISEGSSSGVGDLPHFVECLNKKGVVIYGNLNDNNVRAQLGLFGNYSSQLNLVDCTKNLSLCEGIIIFPTWKVNGVIIHGSLSLNVLSKFSGC